MLRQSKVYRDLLPLPLTTTPITDETATSYIRRLAALNEVPAERLHAEIADSSGNLTVPRLATVSGFPPRSLRYAILELCTTEELTEMRISGRPRPGTRLRPMCDHCAATCGATHTVIRATRHEDVICLRHRRWTGELHHSGGQLSLAGHPEILGAAAKHRMIIAKWGREQARSAYFRATRVCERWAAAGWPYAEHLQTAHEQLRLFHPAERYRLPLDDGTLAAALYTVAIALADVLADPALMELAHATKFVESSRKTYIIETTELERFVAAVRQRAVPAYDWRPYNPYVSHDPLLREIVDGIRSQKIPAHYRLRSEPELFPPKAPPDRQDPE